VIRAGRLDQSDDRLRRHRSGRRDFVARLVPTIDFVVIAQAGVTSSRA
jgi:hypothetical protein